MNFGGTHMQLDLGQKIRELRRRNGRTQEALAEALGVTSQAVSRWEANGGYPDMEMIPSIANYFGISIDELFGYNHERSKRIDALAEKIDNMNFQNNGVDINIDECISFARAALIEFPGNEKLMLCLASVLYNAGYVRYGEYHLSDESGYDVLDIETHRTYDEWKEAISLYEKLLKTLQTGELHHRAVRELTQLYLNTGEHNRANEMIENAPDIYGSRAFLKINGTDGKERAKAYGEALLEMVRACSETMVQCVIAYKNNISVADKIQSLRGAVEIFYTVCTDGHCGRNHSYIARIYTLLSVYLWLDGKKDDAFASLDHALEQFRLFEDYCANDTGHYTAPLVRLVQYEWIQAKANDDSHPHTSRASLAEDWPWWCVPEIEIVKPEIQKDPRWDAWVSKLQ
ncbi:MAG: helix-turn-helix domain-containing protein [Ruminococcaceae bacterium]|nr:helix-turn-helix domain-containing protein [Oscillospiraceae bacterium]